MDDDKRRFYALLDKLNREFGSDHEGRKKAFMAAIENDHSLLRYMATEYLENIAGSPKREDGKFTRH
jgi:hypothetical protein